MPVLGIRGVALTATLTIAAAAGANAQTRAYVANRGASSLTVVDVVTGTVTKTVQLPAAPYDVAVLDDRVFVSMPAANQVAVIDPMRLIVVRSIAVPGAPRDLELSRHPLAWQLFISTDEGLRIYDWSIATLSPPIAVGPGQARALAASYAHPNGQVVVAACDGGATIRALDRLTGTVSAPVATGAAPCAVLDAGLAVYVANTGDDTVTVFTPALQNPLTVPVADQPIGFAQTAAGVWVASASGTLALLDPQSHAVLTSHAIGGAPTAIASTVVADAASYALIVTDAAGTLRVFSAGGALLRTIPTGAAPAAIGLGDSNPSDPVAVTGDGTVTDNQAGEPSMSLDGRFVAFSSAAANIVAGDANGLFDVFVRDRLLLRTTRVSVASAGEQAEGTPGTPRSGSYAPVLSGDGRYVLFLSRATNLAPGDGNGREDLFLHDRDVDADEVFDEPGQISTRRLSVQSDGSEGTCRVGSPTACAAPHLEAALSRDGRHVVFSSLLEFDAADVNGLSDVYGIDIARGRTTRLSLRPGGAPGAGVAGRPVVSANGRVAAFRTSDPGMVAYDSNGVDDVYAVDRDPDGNGVLDEQLPAFTHVSLQPGGASYTTASAPVAINDDGRWVAYASGSTLAIFDRSTGHNALGRPVMPVIGTGQFSPDARYLSTVVSRFASTLLRIDRDADADGILDEAGAVDEAEYLISWEGGGPAIDAAARLIVVPAFVFAGGLGVRDLLGPAAPPFDSDGDGLSNAFEARFGVSATSDAGVDGPYGDPDGDGRTNAQEQLEGTHPRGFQTRFLAEGATGSFFSTRIAVANPGATLARVLLRYQTDTGHTTASVLAIPPMSRRFVYVGNVPSLASASFSTVIEADEPVVTDRTMLWTNAFYGSTAETSVASPSPSWFLAEGATHGAFDLFYLLQNPSPTQAAAVEIRFLRAAGAPIVRTYTVEPSRRLTIHVDDVPGLDAADVSAAITSTNAVPIIVERAMYYSPAGLPFAAGHASAGVTAASTQWFLAEGATGSFFNLFLLLANPSASAADVRITYLRPTGAPIVRTRTLPANSRTTINVAQEDPALTDTPVSTVVESTNAVGIVAERAMWWPASGGWQEAHNSPGATVTATRWGFGDGEVGGPPFNTQTFFLIANTGPQAATVRVTLLLDGASPVARTYSVPANSRFNVPVGLHFPAAAGRGFGAVIESIDAVPVPIVVERAMYSDAAGVVWAAGTDALGTPIP